MQAHRERDVVCGMMVDPARAAGNREYEGKTEYFCGRGCKAKFDAHPGRYVKPGFGIRPSTSSGGIPAGANKWTCPMHPEIVRDAPGSCPICGMALEPLTITAEEPENDELREMTRRFWVGVALTIPTLAIGMA